MIPVMTSTKTDKSAIDLAGVEAGEKIFVPCGDGLLGPLSPTAITDQERRNIVCARNRTVEDFIRNIGISIPFFTPKCVPSPEFAISP
jgi:hypothetical protein